MARIPADELDRLKREVSLERLVMARGIELSRHGKDLIGLCPFHDDREPSLVVTPEKNLWHCLGACREGGSVIDWVMKAERVSFRHAVELLRQDAPLGVSGSKRAPSASASLPSPVSTTHDDPELLDRVVGFYHEALLASPEARAYLEKRGLDDEELITRFRLGYANRTLGYRLPAKSTKKGRELRGRLQGLGVIRSSGHEHLSGSLVVPILDAEGRVAEVYGRKIQRKLRAGTPKHLYLPGPHRGTWNLAGLAGAEEVILCESLIDAMSFWVAGFRQVTTIYGTEGLLDEHLGALQELGVKRVLIAFDRDEAGERAASDLAKTLTGLGIEAFRVQFPRGMDANDVSVQMSPARQSLGLALRKAEWMGAGEAPRRSEPTPSRKERKKKGKKRAAKREEQQLEVLVEAGLPVEAPPSVPAPPLAAASPLPAPPAELEVERVGDDVIVPVGDRRYRVRGLAKNLSYDVLKVNLLASRGEAFHVDQLDLYVARQRVAYQRAASEELGLAAEQVKKDLGQVLLVLERLQDEAIREALEPKSVAVELSEDECEEALALLRSSDLVERIVSDFGRSGVVGEETNKLLGYLATISRKLEEPLAVIVQSSSSAGKSSLMDGVLAFVPEEDRVQYSAMTGQSLFYMGERDLRHKVLAIVEEEGAEKASYALKLLQSEGELSIASTGKDPQTGRLSTHEYEVEGPVMIFLTTTSIDLDEELENRCLRLAVDEGREQTRAIHREQRRRRTLEGLRAKQERSRVRTRHQNAQRLLEPLAVLNPHAESLQFLDTQTRTRRDHEKYLTLIDAIALLHQHQREIGVLEHGGEAVRYVEVEPSDIELANRLMAEALGRTLDELPPQTRRFLELLDRSLEGIASKEGIEREGIVFHRRDARDWTGWSYAQVRTHLERLVEMEYVVARRGRRGIVYELVWSGEGEEGERFVLGLLDPSARDVSAEECAGTTHDVMGQEGAFDPPLTPHLPPFDPRVMGGEKSRKPKQNGHDHASAASGGENALLGHSKTATSQRNSPS